MNRSFLLTAVVMLGAGCGLRHVPLDVLEKLPYEAKIELLEAENDLALAVDRLDEARAEVARARDQIRRGKDRSPLLDIADLAKRGKGYPGHVDQRTRTSPNTRVAFTLSLRSAAL